MAQGKSHNSPPEWASAGAASLYLVGAIHLGIFAFATGRVGPESAPLLGFWILACAIALLALGIVELRRGEALFGTIGVVFGGLLGLGGGLSFIRSMWMPGILAIDGWWFLSAGIILFLLLPSLCRVSWIMFWGIMEIGIALTILGLGMMGVLGSPQVPLMIAGWLALFFAVFCWYVATAQMTNTVYGKRILPF
ncbi:MAG: putative rane protein [Dehalococcoidales bacterium]|nr:putative rane protein [Dehalococcoidales bacterium]